MTNEEGSEGEREKESEGVGEMRED
jgi:hypothetical protein